MHNGFVNVDSEKMSKSLGNFFTIRDVSESYHPLALRWFLIGTQYRQAINYTQRGLEEASDRLFYLYQTLFDAHTVLEGDTSPASSEAALLEEVLDALSDDLNTPLVLAAFSPALKTLNDLIHTKKGKKRPDRIPVMRDIVYSLDVSLGILGLRPTDFRQVLYELCAVALNRADLTEEDVQEAITQRAEARASKEYETADGVRKKLEARGIYIMDTPAGTTWKPGCPTAE